MKHAQQTVCRSWAEFAYPNESMLWGSFIIEYPRYYSYFLTQLI
jgi:hypothetical protein